MSDSRDPDDDLRRPGGTASGDAPATATFAAGAFWDAEPTFGAVDGVLRTRVGFAGGVETDPTFLDPKDHAETVQVDYDSDRVAYADLVERFWGHRDPRAQPENPRYRRVVFWHTPAQRRAVQAAVDAVDDAATAVEPFVSVDLAAPRHQKYRLRQHDDLVARFEGMSDEAVRESRLATRLNGYVAGYGSREALATTLDEAGLTGVPRKRVLGRVHGTA